MRAPSMSLGKTSSCSGTGLRCDGAHSMLFRTFEGQLVMALHCPNIHPRKRMLLFEMDESQGKLRILNEITGNWFNQIGGTTRPVGYREPLREEPCFRKDWT